MGNGSSLLTQYDIEDVQKHVQGRFSQQEVAALYKRFCALDRNGKGYISAEEFMSIPEFALNPLSQRLLQTLEAVNFKDFVAWLAAFSSRSSAQDKAAFIFRIYDSDSDGRVSKSDILAVLADMAGDFLTPAEREQAVTRALKQAGFNEDELLTVDEFCRVLGNNVKMEVEVGLDD